MIILKKMSIVLLAFLLCFAILGATKNTYNSFDNFKIGLVVSDTSADSLSGSYELPLYTNLFKAGFNVYKIDTTSMDDSLFDSRAWKWDTLDVVIIAFGTDSAAFDTSIDRGIGEVPVIVLEPYYWSRFGLPDSNGTTTTRDSFRVNGAFAFIDTSALYSADDSLNFYGSDTTYYAMEPPTHDSNALLLDLAGSDTVVVLDTLNGQPRIAWGLNVPNKFSRLEKAGWTLFNRTIARLVGAHTDSLFRIGMSVSAHNEITFTGEDVLKNRLEVNGHIVELIDTDSLGNANPDPTSLWSELDGFVYWFGTASTLRSTPIKDSVSSVIIFPMNFTGIKAIPDSFDLTTAAVTTATQDSVIILNNTSTLTSGVYGNPESLKVQYSGVASSMFYGTAEGGATRIARLPENTTQGSIILSDTARYAFYGAYNYTIASSGTTTVAGLDLVDRAFGWLFSGTAFQPSGLTLTALSPDCVDVDWNDNTTGEDGYSVFIYEPDSAYYSHLAANVTSDTAFYFWPGNSRVIVDVATISGTDTLFSIGGPDTVYTDARIPPRMFQKSLNDISMAIYLNGYILDERFDDEQLTSSPAWSLSNNVAVDTVGRYLYTSSGTGGFITSVFEADFDTLNDCQWSFDVKFTDVVSTSPLADFYFMSNAAFTNYYRLRIATTGAISLIDNGSTIASTSTGLSAQEKTAWNNYKVERRVTMSPQDTTVLLIVYQNGDSLFSVSDLTHWASDSIRISLENTSALQTAGKYVLADNIQIRQTRPSANHDSTQYAIQDSVSSLYVHDAGDSLRAAEDWRTYDQVGGALGDSVGTGVTGLKADSTYQFRAKARSGWPSTF